MAVRTILVVADADDDRATLGRILEDAGCGAVRTSSGADALATIAEDKPDIVVLDVVMDEMDGFRICRELSIDPGTRGIPVIMVSGENQKVDRLWAKQQGASGHIAKPYTPDEVIEQVRRFT